MWLSVKRLADLMEVTPRAIQKAIHDHVVTARKKDGKSYEVDLTSLPEDMMNRLPEEYRKSAGDLTVVGSAGDVVLSAASREALGRQLTDREKLKAELYRFWCSLDPVLQERQKAAIAASQFGISLSTVRRIVKDVRTNGFLEAARTGGTGGSWDEEAIAWMRSWYLSFLKRTNVSSKAAAYKAVKAEAEVRGWSVGCRSTAYELLSQIPEIMVRYAMGGSRALDNFFYISRDWSKLKPSQIWIGDQHICDFWVVDKRDPDRWEYYRPTLYVWEDGATRCIAGLAVDRDYDSGTVIESIRMGIRRFGFFECTYNDNGSSECSRATTMVVDELLILSDGRSQMKDLSELYRTVDGSYVVEDPDGNVMSVDETPEEWRRKHRRIYAAVKNAKAKPIERLFGSIETRMAQRGIPGHVVTPGAPADQEEKEQRNLDYWKAHDMILTLDEFMLELVKGIDEYEHTYHSALKMSPWEAVQKHIAEGWQARRPANPAELDFIFLSRTRAKVRRGRVTINGLQYKGEDLKVVVGQFVDVGLVLHEGETVDLRYDPHDPSMAYAVFPGAAQKIRPLRLVESIDMLDDRAMVEAIRWKRDQMKAVREVFRRLEMPIMQDVETRLTQQVRQAVEHSADIELPPPEPPKVHTPERETHRTSSDGARLHSTAYERYQWLVDRQLDGQVLDEDELAFMREYEQAPEYEMQRSYWENYRRFYGGH